jgi:hypothetical protein
MTEAKIHDLARQNGLGKCNFEVSRGVGFRAELIVPVRSSDHSARDWQFLVRVGVAQNDRPLNHSPVRPPMAQTEHEKHNRSGAYGTRDQDPGYDPSTRHALSIRVYGVGRMFWRNCRPSWFTPEEFCASKQQQCQHLNIMSERLSFFAGANPRQ